MDSNAFFNDAGRLFIGLIVVVVLLCLILWALEWGDKIKKYAKEKVWEEVAKERETERDELRGMVAELKEKITVLEGRSEYR